MLDTLDAMLEEGLSGYLAWKSLPIMARKARVAVTRRAALKIIRVHSVDLHNSAKV